MQRGGGTPRKNALHLLEDREILHPPEGDVELEDVVQVRARHLW